MMDQDRAEKQEAEFAEECIKQLRELDREHLDRVQAAKCTTPEETLALIKRVVGHGGLLAFQKVDEIAIIIEANC